MDKNIYIPFTKTDEDQRMVYGYASTETLDSQDEVVKLEALKEALPDYMKFGNVREMHSNKAAGKVKESNIDKNGWFVGVKVVADDAWKLVKEGVYSGFSIGGRVIEQIDNQITKLKLSELSLVDRPANPDAVFSCVKFDGEPMKKEAEKVEEAVEVKKGMGDIARLAGIIDELNWLEECVEMEGELEEDKMDEEYATKLSAVISNLGALLVARTQKEVEELNAEEVGEEGEAGGEAETTEIAEADKTEDLAKYDMPTEDEIIDGLKKTEIEINEKNIAIAKDYYAGKIMENLQKDQADQLNKDALESDILKSISEAIKEMQITGEMPPFTYGTLIPVEAEIEPEEADEPVEEAPVEAEKEVTFKADEIDKSQPLAKIDDVMAKLDSIIVKVASFEKLEERIGQIEKQAMPSKINSYAVERFEDKEDKTNLLTKIDEVARKLKANPSDLTIQKEAQDLSKAYMESIR